MRDQVSTISECTVLLPRAQIEMGTVIVLQVLQPPLYSTLTIIYYQ